MKAFLLALIFLFALSRISAQTNKNQQPVVSNVIGLHEISGIVKDSLDEPVIGATVKMISGIDTMRTITSNRGTFIFKNVKSAVFSINVNSIGYTNWVKKYFFNEQNAKLIIEPIRLGTDVTSLKEVIVNGRPTIVYKTDTAEYKASDYLIRKNETVDALLKQLEGVEVKKDGSLTYQGKDVTKAKVNGKTFAGGDVAQAIQNLPADIIDKVQFVNDYGDQAARTGIKDGISEKILNLTTKKDRSVGNLGRLVAGAGNDDRLDDRLFLQRLNGNEEIGVIAKYQQTVNGIALSESSSTNTPGAVAGNTNASGGNLKLFQPNLSYRNTWGKHIEVNAAYGYSSNKSTLDYDSQGAYFSSLGVTNFLKTNNTDIHTVSHNFNLELEYFPDSVNYFKFTPTFKSLTEQSGLFQNEQYNGIQNQVVSGIIKNDRSIPLFSSILFYQHIFKKRRRNFSLQFNFSNSDNRYNNEPNQQTSYSDSDRTTRHFLIGRNYTGKNYRTSATYVEPVSKSSQIEFNVQVNYKKYFSTFVTDSLFNTNGTGSPVSVNNSAYQYSFLEGRFSFNYRLISRKYSLSLGLTGNPTLLKGQQPDNPFQIGTRKAYLIPIFRFEYALSQTRRISVFYSGTTTEPLYSQLQPFVDNSDPQNVIIGNPNLLVSIANAVNVHYDHYMPNSKINLSLNTAGSFSNNSVVNNIIQVPVQSDSYYNEIHFLNANGAYAIKNNISLSKNFNDRRFALNFNGSVDNMHDISYSNDQKYRSSIWHITEHLGSRINLVDWFELNPFFANDLYRANFTQPNSIASKINKTSLDIDGRVFLNDDRWRLGFDASKNYIHGIAENETRNPFVINAYVEKRFMAKKNAIVRLQLFDILKQNNIVNQIITPYSIVNTKSNPLSRYFFLSFTMNLQKWQGTPTRNGKEQKRRGDGSFIN